MRISRCICHGISFAALKDHAETSGIRDEAVLRLDDRHGKGCGLCRPYVRRMMETGQTVFTALIVDEDGESA